MTGRPAKRRSDHGRFSACSLLLAAADPDDGLAKKMLPVYVKEAETYSIAVESVPKKALELKKEPVFEWLNPVRAGCAAGRGVRVAARRPTGGTRLLLLPPARPKCEGRLVMHEFHALDRREVDRDPPKEALNEWKPEAGLERKELPDAPAPADTPAARLIQMRRLAQEFAGAQHRPGEASGWELRLLPTPLYRYPDRARPA